MSETGMGTVIWFDPKAGYGFVKADGGSPDMFVRRSAKRGAVILFAAGERVSYELVTSGKPAKDGGGHHSESDLVRRLQRTMPGAATLFGEGEQHVMQCRSIRRSGQPTRAAASSNARF
jgi:cold shock CspA family protein